MVYFQYLMIFYFIFEHMESNRTSILVISIQCYEANTHLGRMWVHEHFTVLKQTHTLSTCKCCVLEPVFRYHIRVCIVLQDQS